MTPAPVTQDMEGTSKARLFLLCWLQEPTQKPPSTPTIPGNEDPEDSLHFLAEMSPQQLENSQMCAETILLQTAYSTRANNIKSSICFKNGV